MRRFRLQVSVGMLLALVVVALLGLSASGDKPASGEIPTTGATPTRTTVPKYSSAVTVHFTLNGVPFARKGQRLDTALVDVELCFTGIFHDLPVTIDYGPLAWPWDEDPPCNSTGVPVRICSDPPTVCSEEVIFEGDDFEVRWELSEQQPELLDLPAITVKFSHAGVAQPVTIQSWYVSSPARPSLRCVNSQLFPARVSSFVMIWSIIGTSLCDVKEEGLQATFVTEEFGELTATFYILNEDTTLEVDTGGLLATPAPSPTPSPAPSPSDQTASPPASPAALPEAGGPPW